MHTGQPFQSCSPDPQYYKQTSSSQLPIDLQISQHTHTPSGSFLKVKLIRKAWFQYGYDFAHIWSLLAGRAAPKSIQEQGLALRIVRIEELVYTPIGEATIMGALLKPVVLIYNSSGKCTEDVNDLYFFSSYQDFPIHITVDNIWQTWNSFHQRKSKSFRNKTETGFALLTATNCCCC